MPSASREATHAATASFIVGVIFAALAFLAGVDFAADLATGDLAEAAAFFSDSRGERREAGAGEVDARGAIAIDNEAVSESGRWDKAPCF